MNLDEWGYTYLQPRSAKNIKAPITLTVSKWLCCSELGCSLPISCSFVKLRPSRLAYTFWSSKCFFNLFCSLLFCIWSALNSTSCCLPLPRGKSDSTLVFISIRSASESDSDDYRSTTWSKWFSSGVSSRWANGLSFRLIDFAALIMLARRWISEVSSIEFYLSSNLSLSMLTESASICFNADFKPDYFELSRGFTWV